MEKIGGIFKDRNQKRQQAAQLLMTDDERDKKKKKKESDAKLRFDVVVRAAVQSGRRRWTCA